MGMPVFFHETLDRACGYTDDTRIIIHIRYERMRHMGFINWFVKHESFIGTPQTDWLVNEFIEMRVRGLDDRFVFTGYVFWQISLVGCIIVA